MKQIIKIALVLLIFCVGCSNDNSEKSQYLKLKINGVETKFFDRSYPNNQVSLELGGSFFHLRGYYGYLNNENSQSSHTFELIFDKKGNIIKSRHAIYDNEYGPLEYSNYPEFPSNYFTLNIISLDESNKRAKVSFSGNLFLNYFSPHQNPLDFEYVPIEGEFDLAYNEYEYPDSIYDDPYYGNGIDTHCSANINAETWIANKLDHLEGYVLFKASDPYKIEIKLPVDAPLGSHDLSTTSTEYSMKFSKFNTTTHSYDYYNVTGGINVDFKQNLSNNGHADYAYKGTFSFTATNPNNPSEVIQVSEGKYLYNFFYY